MGKEIQQILLAALALPESARAQIADQLLDSLTPLDPDIQSAWAEESQRRLDELKSGKVQGLPSDQVMNRLREKYAS